MRQFRQAVVWGCIGWISTCPYFDLHSNALPLTFGMTPEAAAAALEVPLARTSGRRSAEVYYAEWTTAPGGWWLGHNQHLWLQFRNGRLTGWKKDWDRPSAW
jgi:hypothetical protein